MHHEFELLMEYLYNLDYYKNQFDMLWVHLPIYMDHILLLFYQHNQ